MTHVIAPPAIAARPVRTAPIDQAWRYPVAALLTILTLALRLWLGPFFGDRPALMVFFIPIILSAYFWGLGPGLLATFLAALGTDYFLIPPWGRLGFSRTVDFVQWAVLVLAGILISALSEALHRWRRRDRATIAELRRVRDMMDAALKERADLRAALDTHAIVAVTDPAGRLTFVNDKFCALSGYSREELIGADHNIVNSGQNSFVMMRGMRAAIAAGKVWQGELRSLTKRGEPYWVATTLVPFLDADGRPERVLGIGAEITASKQTGEALRESEELFSRAFRLSPDCVIIVRAADRTILRANDSLCRLWGRTAEELAGRRTEEFATWIEEDQRQAFMRLLFEHGECLDQETVLRLADGSLKTFLFSSRLITLGGEECILSVLHDVTERRRIEITARNLGNRLNTTLESMDSGFFTIDRDWKFTYINKEFERLLGRDRGSLLGNNLWAMFPDAVGQASDLYYHRAMAENRSIAFEDYYAPIDTWFEVNAFPIQDGLAVQFRNINERKLAAEKIRLSEARFRGTLDCMMEGCQIIGRDWKFIYVNEVAARHGRLPADRLVGRTLMECFPGIESTAVYGVIKRCMEHNESTQLENIFSYPDGTWAAFQLGIHATPEGVFILSLDITERRRAEEKVRQVNAELERRVAARTAQLDAANKELEAFSYSVSHDLRAPLRTMDGFSLAALEDYGDLLPDEGKRYLRTIRAGAQRMGALIDDLLTFARLSRQPLNLLQVDADQLVREVIDDLSPQRDGRQIEVRLGSLPRCLGDPTLLRQVWINLLSNAFKYSRNCAQAVIEVGGRQEENVNVYYVRDNGAGFDMGYAHKLFKVFQRLHRAEDYEGTGVGLAIVQRVIHRHGGRVWADSAPNRGATFFFTLNMDPNS